MIIYNSKAVIPGPLIDITKEVVRGEAGRVARKLYNIQAKGTLSAIKGSPNSQGVFWTGSYSPGPADENIGDTSRLASLRGKIKALNDLFSIQGQWFEIQPFDGTQSIKFQPRIRSINFAQGIWYDRVDYTISMEADTIYFGGVEDPGLDNDVTPEETWSIEAADPINRTFRTSHTVSSQQKNLYAADGSIPNGNWGWQRAKTIVLSHLGATDLTKLRAPGVLNLDAGYQPYNWVRSQQIDETSGKFSVTETWLMYKVGWLSVDSDVINEPGFIPPAIDDFSVTARTNNDGITHVNIEGTVTGLEVKDWSTNTILSSKWDNAALYFINILDTNSNIFNRAVGFTGIHLHPIFLTFNVARDPIQGTIRYAGEYNNRRIPLIPGAISETINIQRGGGTDVFASIPVLGRAWGPVLQDIDTITQRSVSISIEAQMAACTVLNPVIAQPNTDGIITSFAPVALQVFKDRDDTSWSMDSGRYNRSVVFVYQ